MPGGRLLMRPRLKGAACDGRVLLELMWALVGTGTARLWMNQLWRLIA